MSKKHYGISLPKWPAMVVVGTPVTPNQAAEIIIRTDGLSFCSNDRRFEAELNDALFGISADYMNLDEEFKRKHGLAENDWNKAILLKEEILSKYKTVSNLYYLKNSRIVSSWIGGPHGWCSWGGRINSVNYNIGKWPSVEEVHKEWKEIAKAFPYLELKCQLFSGETCEETSVPLIQFNIKGGKVRMTIPKKAIERPTSSFEDSLGFFMSPGRERGCTIEQFKQALKIASGELKEV